MLIVLNSLFSPRFQGHGVIFMHIDALSVLCAQLTRDLLAIAKFLFRQFANKFTTKQTGMQRVRRSSPGGSTNSRYFHIVVNNRDMKAFCFKIMSAKSINRVPRLSLLTQNAGNFSLC